jgi:hypothetical protein
MPPLSCNKTNAAPQEIRPYAIDWSLYQRVGVALFELGLCVNCTQRRRYLKIYAGCSGSCVKYIINWRLHSC